MSEGALLPWQVALIVLGCVLLAGLLCFGIVRFVRRRLLNASYQAVNHGLDDEELQFKKRMDEMHAEEIDELFNFSPDDDLAFDAEELGQIEMLDAYRKDLLEEGASPPPTSHARHDALGEAATEEELGMEGEGGAGGGGGGGSL
ncbi:hypothetical protein JKP88DRAFT_334334 [Tribonema minus]|uniref:Uncharacterized protein n=1 Tax=Tribonema minus TaxID=303371 RepID=A0A836C8T1_9STRA|nr:hypothetical protein JKP88DRAFT_334334 [Tribonema minus]